MNADQHAGLATLIGIVLALALLWALYDLLIADGQHLGPVTTGQDDDGDPEPVEPLQRPFTCPDCGARSFHPEDARQGYCGRCHAFTGRPAGLDIPSEQMPPRRTA